VKKEREENCKKGRMTERKIKNRKEERRTKMKRGGQR
jgi:hypothetical protein